ncbi:MAG: hypothetical protein WKF81_11445 [Thermomicrobiales bacterium]
MIPVSRQVRNVISAVLTLLVVLGSLQGVVPASAQLGDPRPVEDLALMTLNPLDLEALDYTGFAINYGLYADADRIAAQLSDQLGGDAGDISDALADNDFLAAYTLELDQSAVIGDPSQGLTQVVNTTIIEFNDEDGATVAYAQLATTDIVPGSTDVSADLESGFAAQGAIAPTAGFDTADGIVAIRQTGDRIAFVVVVPATEAADAAPLLDRLVEKINGIAADGGSDLGLRTLRLTGPAVTLDRGFYSIANSESLRVVTQADDEFERFGQRYDGASAGFQQVQVVSATDGTRLQIRTFALTFASEDDASAWLQDSLERQAELTDPDLIEVDEEFPRIADESNSLTYALSGGNGVRQGTFRDGANVAVIDIVSVETGDRPSRLLLDELTTLQAECLADFCAPQEPPTSLTTGIVATPRVEEPTAEPTKALVDVTETPEESTPVDATEETTAEATEEPTEDVVAPPVNATPAIEESDESGDLEAVDNLYGIQVGYAEGEWEFVSENVDGTRSSFDLTNGTSTVSFVGDNAYAGDPRTCFDDALVYLETEMGATEISEILDAAGNSTIVITDQAAQGLYRYTNADGDLEAAFIYCTTLEPGSTTFLAIGTSPGAEFTTQFPIMVELIEGARISR